MLYFLSSIYRAVVPASIREPFFRRRTQAREAWMQRWNAWIEQPLGGSLDGSERRSRARRYRRERRLQSIRMWLRYRTQFDHEVRTNAAFKQASVAASYYEKSDILPDHVMYESYNGRDFAGNPYAIFLHILEHPRYRHLQHVIAVDDVKNV